MRKKFFLTSAAILWAATAMTSVHAATDVQKVIDETYVQPEYVLRPEKPNSKQTWL